MEGYGFRVNNTANGERTRTGLCHFLDIALLTRSSLDVVQSYSMSTKQYRKYTQNDVPSRPLLSVVVPSELYNSFATEVYDEDLVIVKNEQAC